MMLEYFALSSFLNTIFLSLDERACEMNVNECSQLKFEKRLEVSSFHTLSQTEEKEHVKYIEKDFELYSQP